MTLSQNAGTLSGGEAQRIRLATQIGSNLMGVLYVLDEPSIGLHQRDNRKLIGTLRTLRDIGNTLIVVEHDEDMIRSADHVIDIGPGAGLHGGAIVAEGTPQQIEKNKKSLTGQYLAGKKKIDVPGTRRKAKKYVTVKGCKENNLKNIDVKIPIGLFSVVTGVSGSGKSTLVYDTLYKGMMQKLLRLPGAGGSAHGDHVRFRDRQGDRDRPEPDRPHTALEPGDLHQGLRRDPDGLCGDKRGKDAGLQARAVLV